MLDTPPSIATWLDRAAERLGRAGRPDPRREARTLWAAVARVSPGMVWLGRGGRPGAPLLDHFVEAVARRCAGVPFAYATGRAAFRSLDLAVDPRALIPRPETEGLIDVALRALGQERGAPRGRAADIGTGCGCLALSLAVEGDFVGVVAVDCDPGAAALARENVAGVRAPVPVEVREGDLLAPLGEERFRLIVSNPPYLTDAEVGVLDPAVRRFEPRVALDGGPDGLAQTRRLLADGYARLEPGGLLALEIDERRAKAVADLAQKHGWSRVTIHQDLFGRPRYALAYRAAA